MGSGWFDSIFFQTFMPFRISDVYGSDSDFIDRLNFAPSSVILFVMAVIFSTRAFFTKTIGCFSPTEFASTDRQWQIDYVENTCWVTGVYYWDPKDENLPRANDLRQKYWVAYVQWVPILFLIMSAMFFVPLIFWRLMSRQFGFSLRNIMHVAALLETETEPDANKLAASFAADYIHEALGGFRKDRGNNKIIDFVHSVANVLPCICGRRFGCCLVWLYLLTKLLYVANLVAQFVMINRFLHTSYFFLGIQLLHELLSGGDWTTTGLFPRIVICDFDLRRLANINRYTVQCVLPINMFAEKLFILIWFWLATLLVLTLTSIVFWLWKLTFPYKRRNFIMRYLRILDKKKSLASDRKRLNKKVNHFIKDFLAFDGVFIINLISANAGDMAAMKTVHALWKLWDKEEVKREQAQYGGALRSVSVESSGPNNEER